MDMNYLLTYCEYTYNLAIYSQQIGNMYYIGMQNPMQQYLQQIMRVMDRIGYMSATDNGVTIFVPKSPEMIATAEIINPKLSYKIIEYNHHLLQGDMEAKKSILLLLATELEAKRSKLKQINRKIEDDLFMLFNNMNIRHNNCDENSDNYKAYVSEMSAQQLEQWYDETYQLCLLAFLELDNFKRKEKIKELRVLIESYEKKEQ